jgi:phosphoenolpyruvate carboxylase
MGPRATGDDEALFAELSADVDYLGRCLGGVIREYEGEEIFQRVETVRGLTKALRNPDEAAGDLRGELATLLADLEVEQAECLARAFTVYFQLINLAEEIHRVRVTRALDGQAKEGHPRPGSVAAAIAQLADEGWTYARARELIDRLDVQLTLTAHPTEVKRYTIRLKLERIASAMRTFRERALAPQDRLDLEDAMSAEVATLWRTRELFTQKPSVLDEVKSALYYYRRSLLDAVPRLLGDLDRALATYFPDQHTGAPLPPVIRFRSWIGGDRDGNPFVTPEITTETYRLQSRVALERYRADIDRLVQRLSQWQQRIPPSPELGRLVAETAELTRRHGASGRFAGEPYRERLFFVHRALEQELARLEGSSEERDPDGAAAYTRDLEHLRAALRAAGEPRVAEAFVRPDLDRAAIFGFHLAALDLREHSRVHERAIADLLRYAGVVESYAELAEEERVELLAAEISSRRPLAPPDAALDPETLRALAFLEVLRNVRRELGAESTGGYVVSMTEGASDVLEVLILAKQAGIEAIDAVPLFETVADLERAPGVLARLFAIPAYREHVRRQGIQEVMIGYSDSNKDAGFLAANWALYEAQEAMAAECRRAGVELRLFHGRGTSIGRGGGPAGQAILAQPPGSLGGRMRMTEQGEALDNRYSDPDLAHRHLEQVVHAFLQCSARDSAGPPAALPERYRTALAAAAGAALGRYRGLLEAEGFLAFFQEVTPIDEISRLDIGSRPARRQGDPSLANLRAIPWVFSWTQCRANLPGWFGLGTGLAALDAALPREMYREWPFFRTLLDFAQMSLAKTDIAIFGGYLELVEDPELRRRLGAEIRREHDLTIEQIARATGKPLLADDPDLARSIRLRNPYVDPISRLQVELLKRLRAASDDDPRREALSYAVKVTLIGIAAGMRNTG